MRNVVVTGGSRGLGLGIARRLAASGFSVIAISRTQTESLADAIGEAGRLQQGSIRFWSCDLVDLPALPAMVKSVRRELGPIYGLVNNAGIGTPGVLANMKDPDIEQLIRLNVTVPMMLTKYVVRSMLAHNEGRIVNISSVVGLTGYSGLSVYSATKAALCSASHGHSRREAGKLGITVNAVAPGFVDTEMTHGVDPARAREDHAPQRPASGWPKSRRHREHGRLPAQ